MLDQLVSNTYVQHVLHFEVAPWPILDAAVGITAAFELRRDVPRMPILQALASVILCSLGGSILMSTFLLNTAPTWLANDRICGAYVLAWILAFCLPRTVSDVLQGLFFFPPIRVVLLLLTCISQATSVSTWGMAHALKAIPNASFVAIACGMFAAGAGKLVFVEAFNLNTSQWRLAVPPSLVGHPAPGVLRAIVGTFAYYVAYDPHRLVLHRFHLTPLSEPTARFLLMAAFALHALGHYAASPAGSPKDKTE